MKTSLHVVMLYKNETFLHDVVFFLDFQFECSIFNQFIL